MINSIKIIKEELDRLSHDENNILLVNQIANLIANHHAKIAFKPVKIKGARYNRTEKKYQVFTYKERKVNGKIKQTRTLVFETEDAKECILFKNKKK